MRMPRVPALGHAAVLAALAAVSFVGCGSDDPASSTSTERTASSQPPSSEPEVTVTDPRTTRPSDPEPSAPPGGGSIPAGLQALVDIAVADLVERRGLAGPDDVEVVSVEEVTWSDRGLGCPQKDMQYQQVLTPGTRIVLRADGNAYSYHAGNGRDPFYCPNPQPPRDAAGT